MKQTKYFKGSKVPVSFLMDYIKEGYTISDFLSSYPWLKKDDLLNTLEEFKKKLDSSQYAV